MQKNLGWQSPLVPPDAGLLGSSFSLEDSVEKPEKVPRQLQETSAIDEEDWPHFSMA